MDARYTIKTRVNSFAINLKLIPLGSPFMKIKNKPLCNERGIGTPVIKNLGEWPF